jgi:hypothetical protein
MIGAPCRGEIFDEAVGQLVELGRDAPELLGHVVDARDPERLAAVLG